MAKPRVLVLRAPGTNCDEETAFAFESAGGEAVRLHVNRLIENPLLADNYQILALPGGFSYGDDIAAGRILATQLTSRIPEVIEKFRSEDRLVLGICNGFQIMMRSGIFFDRGTTNPPITLFWNAQGRYEARWVHVKVGKTNSPFLNGLDTLYLPMAHAEGRILFRDQAAADELETQHQLALRYCTQEGETSDVALPFPTNPNGAANNIAGITDVSGRIMGLMPHPERHLVPTHHPAWTRREMQPEHGDGFAIFKNAVEYFA
jgi:phosphoribosylformylglycinamidine synthase subunit PurQ / glutaminase